MAARRLVSRPWSVMAMVHGPCWCTYSLATPMAQQSGNRVVVVAVPVVRRCATASATDLTHHVSILCRKGARLWQPLPLSSEAMERNSSVWKITAFALLIGSVLTT